MDIEALKTAALGEIRAIARSGIGADYLTKAIEQMRREHEINLKSNNWWRGRLRAAYYHRESFARTNDLDAAQLRVTSANVKASAARFLLDEKNLIVGILRPTNDAAPAPAPAPAPPAAH